jgi:hypothetical protein
MEGSPFVLARRPLARLIRAPTIARSDATVNVRQRNPA